MKNWCLYRNKPPAVLQETSQLLTRFLSNAVRKAGFYVLIVSGRWAELCAMVRVVKDTDFDLVAEIQKPDARKRLSLGSVVEHVGLAYNIYRNRLGQIMLDPVIAVPVYEAWLFENKPALASVKRGLVDSAAGRTKTLGSFAAHAKT